jgi:hypothetical protein
MKRFSSPYAVWGLSALFVAAIALAIIAPRQTDLPYSSGSTSFEGTRAAYLLLKEYGFDVRQNRARVWGGDGILLALGPEYLPSAEMAMTLNHDWLYTNRHIADDDYAAEFLGILWDYRDEPIYFEEYGRTARQIGYSAEPLSLSDIAPDWLKLAFLHLAVICFFAMFFYRQRLGKPQTLAEFAARHPLEAVYAMAGAMRHAHLYGDSARAYYKYQAKKGAPWDADKAMQTAASQVKSEREALAFVAKLDQLLRERDEFEY